MNASTAAAVVAAFISLPSVVFAQESAQPAQPEPTPTSQPTASAPASPPETTPTAPPSATPTASATATAKCDRTASACERPSFAVSTNPVGDALGFFNLEGEYAVARRMTVFLEPSYFRISPVAGPALTAGGRFFFLGHALKGLWAGAEVFTAFLSTATESSRPGFGAGIQAGGTWPLFRHVYLSGGVNANATFSGLDSNGVPVTKPAFAVLPRVNVGGAF